MSTTVTLVLSAAIALAACGEKSEPASGGAGLPAPMLRPGSVEAGGAQPNKDGGSLADAGAALQYAYPEWERADLQPQSPLTGQTYGLEAFRGRTVVVVLLEGYCPYCQSNAKVAEQLQRTLREEKREVEIVVLADNAAAQFVGKVGLRIFHDNLPNRPAWQAMRAKAYKHDTFVFAPNGMRTYFWEGSYTGDAARWTEDVGAAVRAIAR